MNKKYRKTVIAGNWKMNMTASAVKPFIEELKAEYDKIILIANSIGAFFSMNADIDSLIEKAYFISPIVDMERLITDMLAWENVTEDELKEQGIIHTSFGEDLSWEYLCYVREHPICYVREHPIKWNTPTAVLYGDKDNLTSYKTIADFAEKHTVKLTVMENGEHWFHTDEQMRFLDDWIVK